MLSALLQATRYLYVVYWTYKFYFRFLVGYIVPPILVILSIIELVSAVSHAFPWAEQFPIYLKISIAALLLVAAAVLIYHHHRLEVRIKRHAVLLSSIMVLLEAQTLQRSAPDARAAAGAQEEACSDILDALVFALEHERPGPIRASIVYRGAPEEPFSLRVQDANTAFDGQISLHPLESTAAKVAHEPPGAIVYIPWTRCLHGVLISAGAEYTVGQHQRFRTTQILADAFQRIEMHEYPEVLQALLCIQIPIGIPGACAVLCISGGKRDCMGDLDFHAAKLAAALISLATKTP